MNPDTWLVPGLGLALALVVTLPFVRRQRRQDRRARASAEQAVIMGLDEPVSLHPVVNLERCIGTGSCVEVCPEGDVLAIRDGVAHPIAPGRCIGHGLCERSCPVEAIQLVFGTAKRGVDLPRIRQNFETNVPGMFIVGELGGMGLIRNAFEQGRQCIQSIAEQSRKGKNGEMLDLIVVGCGPAGLSASLHAMHQKLRFRTFEREDIGGTVRHYPRKKLVMSAPLAVPGYGKVDAREIRKEELMSVWTDIVKRSGLQVGTQEPVEKIARATGGFEVTTARGGYTAHRVVLAIGRRGKPRRLGVPGEDRSKVTYALHEPEAYQGDKVLVVGGGDSAVEAALALASLRDTQVTMSYRRERFTRLKPANRERIDRAFADKSVRMLWSTNVKEIKEGSVVYGEESGASHEIPNDDVMIFAGGELPTEFLKSCGVAIDTKFGTR